MASPFESRSHFGLLRAYVLGLGLLSIAACARDATELVGDGALAFDIEDDGRFRVSSVYDRELADGFLIKGQGRFRGARPCVSSWSSFAEHPQTVLGREELHELTHGRDAVPFDRSVEVRIGRLRRRIEADPKKPELIKTVRGGGYVFAVSVDVE